MKLPPRVVVIAGPNGAGKSTIAPALLNGPLAVKEFVNADAIASGLSAFNPEGVAMQAGRIMLARIKEIGSQGISFAFETTLASRTFVPIIKELSANGYEFHLVYLWLANPDEACARVATRIRSGGHSVPEATIRRRYHAGIRNFFQLYRPLATSWQVLNNAASGPRGKIAFGSGENEQVLLSGVWQEVLKESDLDA